MSFDLLIYLISLIIMGSNGIVASFLPLNSYEIIFIRTFIGSIVLITTCIIKKEKFLCLRHKEDVVNLIFSGLALGGGWIFLFEGYRIIGVSISTLLYYCGPMLAMLISPIFYKEKLTIPKIIGAIIVFIGIILLNGKLAGDPTKYFGIFCGIMAGLSYMFILIFNKKIKYATGIENTTCQLVVSFILVTIYMLFNGGIHIVLNGIDWIPALWIGLINTSVSCLFYYSTIIKLPMSTVAICSYLDPVSAVLLSALILHESLSIIQIVGVVFVIGGAAFSQLYKME